jgi:hypothetical protein
MTHTIEYWQKQKEDFIELRRGVAGAGEDEFIADFLDDYRGIFVTPDEGQPGESLYIWYIDPDERCHKRIVRALLPGLYIDHQGHLYELPPERVIVLGTVSRIGPPLFTRQHVDLWRGGEQ